MKKILLSMIVCAGLLVQADMALAVRPSVDIPEFIKQPILNEPAPNGDDAKIVRDAIKRAGLAHGWETIEDTPEKVRLFLSQQGGKHQLTVDVAIEKDVVTITYVDSSNLGYQKNADGTVMIHPSYERWVNNLLKTARTYAFKMVFPDAKPQPVARVQNNYNSR